MRNAALPKFRKLHRIIKEKQLDEGTKVNVTIFNWFPVDQTNSQKYVVLTTTKWIGGHNYFLAWAFISVGCAFIVLAITFAIILLIGKRALKTTIQTKTTEKRIYEKSTRETETINKSVNIYVIQSFFLLFVGDFWELCVTSDRVGYSFFVFPFFLWDIHPCVFIGLVKPCLY
ncbi:hypothetical protein RFI_20066 [Reticulomyxa filosa]|uniref:Uncharacterized protein n=1 Tax=Reticulomyxa filosa TaxID=46433 RepID=X6MTF4_RETFI|nr:hypothetical protein RFI_20066 [Reticulomyxa filosa]|eukprot:ETO17263.1 hypothetical protein RFI_20066 [Reticulomyxa filosa]